MHYRQTTLVHLADSDTLNIERDRTGMIGATVRDATGVNNLLINSRFEVDQRAASPATVTGASTGWISLHGITWNGELPLGGQYTVNL